MLQLELFTKLPIPSDARPWKRNRWPRIVEVWIGRVPEQLTFVFRLRYLECDRDTDFDFPRRVMVDAATLEVPATRAKRSIFDLAKTYRRFRKQLEMSSSGGHIRIEAKVVNSGVTQFFGASYPSRCTLEDEERERVRRARQKPPPPSKRAKTRGRKLLEIIGDEEEA